MLVSTAIVTTDAPARYAKQLLSHLGHKVTMEPLPDQPAPAGRLVFAYGIGTVMPLNGDLVMRAAAANAEALARVQDVLGRHLLKFGARRELVISWQPAELIADDSTGDSDAPAGPAVSTTGAADSAGRSAAEKADSTSD
jgi:uncharacterized protein